LDNDFPEHWRASYGLGTPGKQNFSNTIEEYNLSQNYPNPCQTTTSIDLSMQEAGYLTIQVHDVFGRKISTLINDHKEKSTYNLSLDTSYLPTGIYFYTMVVDNQIIATKKMMVIH
jgi:hypothetical protein